MCSDSKETSSISGYFISKHHTYNGVQSNLV